MSELEVASARTLKSGYFERLYLFDSNGERRRVTRFETTSARVRGPLGELVGVQLFLGPAETPPLGEIAEELCWIIDADSDDLYNQHLTHDELKARLRAAPSVERLIAIAGSLGEETLLGPA